MVKASVLVHIQILHETMVHLFLSHLLIAGCDIGVQISVRPYVRSFVRPCVRSSVNIYVEVSFSRHKR